MKNQTVGVPCQACGVLSYGEREHCMNCNRLLLPHRRPLTESEAEVWVAQQMELRHRKSLPVDFATERALFWWAQSTTQPTQSQGTSSDGCIVGIVIVAALLILLLIWVSSWSCGPGKGKCSFVSMQHSTAAITDAFT